MLARRDAVRRLQHLGQRAGIGRDGRRNEAQCGGPANLQIAGTMEFAECSVSEERLQFEVGDDAGHSDAGIILGAPP